MKILSVLLTILFLFSITSIAQIRYAITHPLELGPVLLNFAMAFCIYMILSNSTKIRLPKNFRMRLVNLFTFKSIPIRQTK